MTRIEQVQAEINKMENPLGDFEAAIKFLKYWSENITPNVPYLSNIECEEKAIDFWGTHILYRNSVLDVGIHPDPFTKLFANLAMRIRVVEWKANENAKFLFEEIKHNHEKYLQNHLPKEHKRYYLKERITEIEKLFEPISDNTKTSYAEERYVRQLVLFYYEKPFLLEKMKELEEMGDLSFETVLIQDVSRKNSFTEEFKGFSATNDWGFYLNALNANLTFVRETKAYFETGERKGFINSLAFMNLFWKQREYLKANLERPNSTLQYFESLPLTKEQRHVLYGFLLKYPRDLGWGYPIRIKDCTPSQAEIALLLVEEAFLKYKGDTPEKKYCHNTLLSADTNYDLISINTLPTHYQYDRDSFEGIALDNDWDYYHNVENIPNQEYWVLTPKKYFQSGHRAGFIEPLAFMNLFWKQYQFMKENYPKNPYGVFQHFDSLPLNSEVKHVFFGLFLKLHGGYPIDKNLTNLADSDNYRMVLILIEEAFLRYEDKTFEKEFCRRGYGAEMAESITTTDKHKEPIFLDKELSLAETQKSIEEPDNLIGDSEMRNSIKQLINSVDTNGWEYVFRSETDFNRFVELLCLYFEKKTYTPLQETIPLQPNCKTRFAPILRAIYNKHSSLNIKLKKDIDFFNTIRVLNCFNTGTYDEIYKAITR